MPKRHAFRAATDVLADARARRAAADKADAELLGFAVEWALLHPASADDSAGWVPGFESEVPLAGEGAPLVAEFCVAEFGAALAMSEQAGRALLAEALELQVRLPRLWAAVQAGRVPAWRARRVAGQTMALGVEAVEWADRQIAVVGGRIGPVQAERLVAEAAMRFQPAETEAAQLAALARRHVTIFRDQVSTEGTMHVEADLDIPDALDLDAALTDRADQLKTLGCTEDVDVRRSIALGDLARRQLTLDFDSGNATPLTSSARTRRVVLHVHLNEAALSGVGVARVEGLAGPQLATRVAAWCARPETEIVVKPVINLSQRIHVDAYEIPDRIREHVVLRDVTCVFPFCHRSARSGDIDHVIPYDSGGPTATDNLAALCRHHHRLKTHGRWHYRMRSPGCYIWTSPHGHRYLRDQLGTSSLDPPT